MLKKYEHSMNPNGSSSNDGKSLASSIKSAKLRLQKTFIKVFPLENIITVNNHKNLSLLRK